MDNLWSDIASFIVGAIGGSLLTFQITKKTTASHGSRIVDQSGAKAGRDIIGGNRK